MPLTGNDILVEGGLYTINAYGTRKVWTHEGSDIYLRVYQPGNQQQIFRATLDENKRFGLVCLGSNVRVGRNSWENLKCASSVGDRGAWEALHFWRAPKGGYRVLMTKDERFCPLKVMSGGSGDYLKMVADADDSWGLTRVGTNDVFGLFWRPPHFPNPM